MASSNLNKSSGSLLTAAEVNSLLKFDGSDQVGIGTTSPLINLHIQSNATSETGLRLDNTDTGGKSWDIVSTGSSSTSGLAAGGLAFWNADDGAARMVLTTDGNVGIATTSPGALLHTYETTDGAVNTIIEHTDDDSISLYVKGGGNNSSNGAFIVESTTNNATGIVAQFKSTQSSATKELVSILAGGAIGVGTTSPDGTFHIQVSSAGAVTANNAGNELVLENNGECGLSILSGTTSSGRIYFGDADANERGIIFYNHSSDSMNFYTAGASAVTIDASQNVGVGVAPTARMDIFKAHNGATNMFLRNTTAGTAAFSRLAVRADDCFADLYAFSTLYSTSGQYIADTSLLESNGGDLSLSSTGATNIRFWTNSNERMRIDSSGKLSTGGETSPDVDAGGITLNHGVNDGNVLTFKNSDVAHGVTSFLETDTYAAFGKNSPTAGGIRVKAATESTRAFVIDAVNTVEDTTDTTTSKGCIQMQPSLKLGTSQVAIGSTANGFTVTDGSNTRFIIKGNGDIHATNTTITALDTHPDIKIARNLQLATGGKDYKHRVSKEEMQQLIDLKLLSTNGDFQILQGCTAVTLGAVGQLFNMFVNIMSEKLGVTQEECLAASMQYVH